MLAKELASVDVLSNGRVIFGVGVGYLGPEFEALGVPMADRGQRTTEYIEAMRSIWNDERPAYEGSYVSFAGVNAFPRPVQRPGPPVVMGGHSKPAWRRAVTHSEWYGFMLPEATATNLAGLAIAAGNTGDPTNLLIWK